MQEIVIKIPEEMYEWINDVNKFYEDYGISDFVDFIKNGTVLPKGHGRLIDADAFIETMKDASKRQKYNEVLISDCLTVDDIFKAIIESLQNEGLANGDTPTIIEGSEE